MTNSYIAARDRIRRQMSLDAQRNALARDRGYPCYALAPGLAREEIDKQLDDEADRLR